MELTIEVNVPSGELPSDGDLSGLVDHIDRDLAAIQSSMPSATVSGPKKSAPPPGVTGVTEVIAWSVQVYMEHKSEIDTFLEALPALIGGLRIAAKVHGFFKPDKPSDNQPRSTINVSIGNVTINIYGSDELEKKALEEVARRVRGDQKGGVA